MFSPTQSTTLLSEIKNVETTFATPNHSVAPVVLATGTMYFKTSIHTPPARPPAVAAKPMKSTTRAFHASPSPEYEEYANPLLSPASRDLSIELTISMPSTLKMIGIQSTNVMWKSLPLRAEAEKLAASMKMKKPIENWFFSHVITRESILATWGGRGGNLI